MSVKHHYEKHLSRFYSWMVGDFKSKEENFITFLKEHNITPSLTKTAIDLGAGHGIYSSSLVKAGYKVIAVDFNDQLLEELKENTHGMDIELINDDIRNTDRFKAVNPELILCMGDTLTHLDDKNDVKTFLDKVIRVLHPNGKLIISFRDYSKAETGKIITIPVKEDENRNLTCILRYETDHVVVTDKLSEKKNGAWQNTESSYMKVRISPLEIRNYFKERSVKSVQEFEMNGMITMLIEKHQL